MMVALNHPETLLDILHRASHALDAAEARASEAEARADHANDIANQLLEYAERRTRESKERILELEATIAAERQARETHSQSFAEGVRALEVRVRLAEAQAQAMATKAVAAEARANAAEARMERLRAAFDDITSAPPVPEPQSGTAGLELRRAVH